MGLIAGSQAAVTESLIITSKAFGADCRRDELAGLVNVRGGSQVASVVSPYLLPSKVCCNADLDGLKCGERVRLLGNPWKTDYHQQPQKTMDHHTRIVKPGTVKNDAILAGEKQMGIYEEIEKDPNVQYTAGDSGQNSLRVWILKKQNSAAFFGAVGEDRYSKILEREAISDGLDVKYQYHSDKSTELQITSKRPSYRTPKLGRPKNSAITLKTKKKNKTKLKTLQKDIREKGLIEENGYNVILEDFDGMFCEIFKNQLKNKNNKVKSRRYSDELKKFALTLNYYSPKAYKYCCTIFKLPQPTALRSWTSSVNGEPGFFSEVFLFLKILDTENKECYLVLDAMNLTVESSETAATEALVLCLYGANNNPNVIQFKTAIKQILLKNFTAEDYVRDLKAELLGDIEKLQEFDDICRRDFSNVLSLERFKCQISNYFDWA
ncbi:hypothetical protein AGLY_001394 [Aphis glycines]|uniref:adenosine kinase n=1 Tax=Aphis glycines TaxID=307491 RepID=A0A6G0U525_APHGL|nr:hypothetical protein AGLY_001394 [Aphis glycines]